MFERTPTQAHRTVDVPRPKPREDARAPQADPLALDPYSPVFVTRAPEWNGPEPLALDPYSPIVPRLAGRK
jgi:hypothetical protein